MSRTQMKHSSKSNSKRNDYSGSQVIFAGNWGQWLPLQTAPAGSFLCGILYNHSLDSPKAANQVGVDGVVAVFCNAQNWKTQKEETCAEKSFGDYRELMCPEGSYAFGVSVKQVPPETCSDNDGIETIQLICYNPYTHVDQIVSGLFVNFGIWVDSYQPKFFNALQVRYEGEGVDPTGTNGMAGSIGDFKCNDGYLLQYNIQCFKALDNCKADKQSADKCSECNDGFLLFDSACYKTITQCVTQDKEKCTKCSCGHFLNYDALCYYKLDNCVEQAGNYCKTCIDLMTTSTSGKCIQQIANCAEQQDTFCVVCNKNFNVSSNICVRQDAVKGCSAQDQASTQAFRRQKSLKIKSNKNVKRNKVNSKRLSMRN